MMRRITLSMLIVLYCVSGAFALIDAQSPVDPEETWEAKNAPLPTPLDIPGKEYSNYLDKDAAGNLDPGQIVHWKGDASNVWDSFDVIADGIGEGGVRDFDEVDALSNNRDLYFNDLSGDRVPLLASFDDVADIHVSRSSVNNKSVSVWAKAVDHINATPGALDDLDGLEVHGPDGSDDADMFSALGDPFVGGNRVSVFRYDPTTKQSTPYLFTQTLIDVVITDDEELIDWNLHNDELFDVDAMLIWNNDEEDFDFDQDEILTRDGQYEVRPDQIIFSVRPIDGLFDGGEVFVYKYGDEKASFLVHGEGDTPDTLRTWNTANDVSTLFGVDSENINALEVLPEPATIGLLAMGTLFMMKRRK